MFFHLLPPLSSPHAPASPLAPFFASCFCCSCSFLHLMLLLLLLLLSSPLASPFPASAPAIAHPLDPPPFSSASPRPVYSTTAPSPLTVSPEYIYADLLGLR